MDSVQWASHKQQVLGLLMISGQGVPQAVMGVGGGGSQGLGPLPRLCAGSLLGNLRML